MTKFNKLNSPHPLATNKIYCLEKTKINSSPT